MTPHVPTLGPLAMHAMCQLQRRHDGAETSGVHVGDCSSALPRASNFWKSDHNLPSRGTALLRGFSQAYGERRRHRNTGHFGVANGEPAGPSAGRAGPCCSRASSCSWLCAHGRDRHRSGPTSLFAVDYQSISGRAPAKRCKRHHAVALRDNGAVAATLRHGNCISDLDSTTPRIRATW